jgi:hypothetical protein
MKFKFTLLVAFATLIFNSLEAQDVDRKEVKINYVSRPLKPLNKDIKSYSSTVVLAYIEKNKKLMEEYEAELKKADAEFDADVKAANEEYDKAMVQYNKDLDVYNNKNAAQKLVDKKLNNEGKPVPPYKRTPSKRVVDKPAVQKEVSATMLATNYMKLQGYKSGTDNAVKITGTLLGYEIIGPKLVTEEYTEYKNGATIKSNKYRYEIQYRHPMGVKVETASEGVLLDEFPAKMNEFTKVTTDQYNSTYDLDKYWNQAKSSYLSSLEDKILASNMEALSALLNSNFGYPTLTRLCNVYTVTDKKGTYKDYETAATSYEEGYKLLSENVNKTNAIPKINEAIALWETAMKESDPANKKARVDKDVTEATLFNLVEASVFVDDFDKAEKYWKQLHKMDLSKKEQKRAEELEAYVNDQKARFAAGK